EAELRRFEEPAAGTHCPWPRSRQMVRARCRRLSLPAARLAAAPDRPIPEGIRRTSAKDLELAIHADHAEELLRPGLSMSFKRPQRAAKRALPVSDLGDFRERSAARHITGGGANAHGAPASNDQRGEYRLRYKQRELGPGHSGNGQ